MTTAHREEKKGSEPAGLDIHGQSLDPDIIHTYMLYDTFDIDFETSSSKYCCAPALDTPLTQRTRPGKLHSKMG
jgi:hypothetical protein